MCSFRIYGRWLVQASKHRYTCAQCCHTSVGLAQARPNYKYMCKILVWQYLVLFQDHHPHFARRGLVISLTGYSPSAVNLSSLGTYVCTIKPERTYCRLISVCAYDKHMPTHVIHVYTPDSAIYFLAVEIYVPRNLEIALRILRIQR